MGLFDSLPPPGPRCVGGSVPPWLFPPDNVLGSFVPERVVLVRSESLLVVGQGFVAYPTGVDFSVEIQSNERVPGGFAVPDRRRRPGPAGPQDGLAVGVVTADGGRASSLSRPNLEDEPMPPVVSTYRGGVGGTGWRQRCWMWPLPPPGPLHIVVAWLGAGLGETWGELDGATLRDAGLRARVLWD